LSRPFLILLLTALSNVLRLVFGFPPTRKSPLSATSLWLPVIITQVKTQIITLESHDDLISVRDRMSWAKTPRILLVWPKYEKIVLRQVDLKVLQRHASSLGAQLGLVTRERRVRGDAEALRIPVFVSAGEAQRLPWPKLKRKRLPHHVPDKTLREKREQLPALEEAWRARPWVRVSAFIVGVLSVLFLVALFIPRAQVTLNPVTQIQSVALPVTASTSVDAVFITGSIPVREKRIVASGEQTITVTGEGVVPQSKASGVAEFRNLTESVVTIPIGTIVTAGDVRFVTTELGVLNAGVGETAELKIEALEGGQAGNLQPETINAIDGRLGLSVSVINLKPMTGGRERASVQASDADRTRVKELLMKSLESDARQQIVDELNIGDVLFDGSFTITQILSELYDPPAGAAGSKLKLTMQAEYSIQYADASDLTQLASLALNASLPSGFLVASTSDALTIKTTTKPTTLSNGSTRWTIQAERKIVQLVDADQVIQTILGLSSESAQTVLDENLPLASSPRITFTPSWWKWVPIVPFRVEVVTQ